MEPMDAGNVWISRVEAARRRMPAWAALALAIAVLALALGPIPIWLAARPALSAGSPFASLVLNRTISYALIFAPLYLCALASVRLWEKRARLAGALTGPEAALMGAIAGLAGFAAVMLVSLIAGSLQVETPVTAPGLGTLAGVVAGGALLAFQSGAEEYFFRGWLQPAVSADWGPWIGLVLSSLLFAVAHGFSNVGSATGFINLFLAGGLFGILALRTGSFCAAFGAHWLWNWLEQSIAGLTPNPGIDKLGSLLDLKLTGSALMGAGPDELNGALTVTAIFAALILLFALLPGRNATSPAL